MTATVNAARQRVNSLTDDGIKDCRRAVLQEMLNRLVAPGLQTIAQEIIDCADNRVLKDLARDYITFAFQPMKATGGRTAPPTPSPIGGEETEVDGLADQLRFSQPQLSSRVVEASCLPRDGYRCVVSGHWSLKTPANLQPANFLANAGRTEACHIIPSSLAQHGNSDQSCHNASRIWDTLCKMFPGLQTRIVDHLENIRAPSNLLTFLAPLHQPFGQFRIAFEAQPGQHVYRVRDWGGIVEIAALLPQDRIVRFRDHTHGITPLPDPYLLQVHHIIAEILHASGLAEILDEFVDDYDSLRGLASDGSTSLPFLIEKA